MPNDSGCGDTTDVGQPLIVGVEDAFTGRGTDPEYDPTGLGLLLAIIDGRYWPLQVCGDTGIGAPFTENPVGVNKGGNVDTRLVEFGEPITAHGCLMNCDYRITQDLDAEVIVAKIDEVWQILRVRHTSATFATLSSSNDCRCCGITPQRETLYYRILSNDPPGCGLTPGCDEYVIDPSDDCLPSAENPLSVQVGCGSTANSELEQLDDWVVEVCGLQATVTAVICSTPSIECESGYAEDYPYDQFQLYVTAVCNGCEYNLFIYDKPTAPDPCALEDVPIEIVDAEACGIPDLAVGDRVIVAHVPVVGEAPYEDGCPKVEYFVIRACSSKDCADPCDPPEPPITCCGILCADLPATLEATVEILDCDCACSFVVTLTKQPCLPGSERGEWRYDPGTPQILCEDADAKFELTKIQLMCDDPGYDNNGFSMVADGQTGELVASICESGSMYFEFEFANLPLCLDKLPGRVPVDLNCRARITVIE